MSQGSGGGPKRTKAQRQLDKVKICHMLARGMTFRKIGEALNISHVQALRDYQDALQQIEEHVTLHTPRTARVLAIHELQEMNAEAFSEWDRSKQNAEKVVTVEEPREQCPVCTGDGHIPDRKNPGTNKTCWKCLGKGEIGGIINITRTVEGRLGDPRYLQVAGQALKMELELRGVARDGSLAEDEDGKGSTQIPWQDVVRKIKEEQAMGIDPIKARMQEVLQRRLQALPQAQSQPSDEGTPPVQEQE